MCVLSAMEPCGGYFGWIADFERAEFATDVVVARQTGLQAIYDGLTRAAGLPAANRRYVEFIATIEDDKAGTDKLDKVLPARSRRMIAGSFSVTRLPFLTLVSLVSLTHLNLEFHTYW